MYLIFKVISSAIPGGMRVEAPAARDLVVLVPPARVPPVVSVVLPVPVVPVLVLVLPVLAARHCAQHLVVCPGPPLLLLGLPPQLVVGPIVVSVRMLSQNRFFILIFGRHLAKKYSDLDLGHPGRIRRGVVWLAMIHPYDFFKDGLARFHDLKNAHFI